MVMVDRLKEHRNDLLIIDTKDFTKPCCIVQLPFHTRPGVHGNWVDVVRLSLPLGPAVHRGEHGQSQIPDGTVDIVNVPAFASISGGMYDFINETGQIIPDSYQGEKAAV